MGKLFASPICLANLYPHKCLFTLHVSRREKSQAKLHKHLQENRKTIFLCLLTVLLDFLVQFNVSIDLWFRYNISIEDENILFIK